MKNAILALLERLGYVVLRVDMWRSMEHRLAQAEANTPVVSQQAGLALHPGTDALRDQAQSISQPRTLQEQLDQCRHERDRLHRERTWAQRRLQATKRHHVHAHAELKRCRSQLARSDTTGRIRALEEENRRLAQRVLDLEVYLEETRGSCRPYFL